MILIIFSMLMLLAVFFITIGVWTDDPLSKTIGFGFMLISSIGFFGGIEYSTGTITNATNTENIITTHTYTTYENTTIALLFLLVSGIALAFSSTDIFNTNDGSGPERINWRFWR